MSGPLDIPTGLLATLRAAVVERLSAAADFQDPVTVPVLDGGKTDIISRVSQALTARTGGLCVVVTAPRVAPFDVDRGIAVTISVQIYEHPLQNWSEKGPCRAPEDAGEAVMASLMFDDDQHPGWTPSPHWTVLQFEGLRPVFASTEQTVWEILFRTHTLIRSA